MASRSPASPTARLWRHGEFLRLWGAQAISAFGARITREGIPLAAVLTIHAEPAQLGVLAALSTGPQLVVGLLAGGWVDRSKRRRLMIGADVMRALVLITVPIAAWMHWLTMVQLYGAAALVGAGSVLFDIADHAYLPGLIERGQLVEGNTKLRITESAAEIAGPALTGILIQLLTAPIAILVNALTYLASAAVLLTIRKAEPAPVPSEAEPLGGLAQWRDDLARGFAIVWHEPLVRPLWLMTVTTSLFGSIFAPTYLYFAIKTLGLTPAMLGVTIAFGGVGALTGAVLGQRMARWLGLGPAIIAATVFVALALALIPFAPANPVGGMGVLLVQQFLGDAFGMAAAVLGISLRQTVLPDEVMGRAGALFQAGPGAAAITGALGGGALSQTLGVRPAMMIAAAGLLSVAFWGLASPLRRLKVMPDGPDDAELP